MPQVLVVRVLVLMSCVLCGQPSMHLIVLIERSLHGWSAFPPSPTMSEPVFKVCLGFCDCLCVKRGSDSDPHELWFRQLDVPLQVTSHRHIWRPIWRHITFPQSLTQNITFQFHHHPPKRVDRTTNQPTN